MNRTVLPVVLLIGVMFAGCDLLGADRQIECLLPQTPKTWMSAWGVPGYGVVVTAGPGIVEKINVPAGTPTIALVLPKESVVSIVAYPRWDHGPAVAPGETLFPAGAVWPHHALDGDRSQVELSYEMGFVAYTLGQAIVRAAPALTFNVRRFTEEVVSRVGRDPWLIDGDSIITAICNERMRADYLREEPTESFEIELPAGLWHRRSPFAEPINGGTVSLDLPFGLTVLYDTSGRRALFDVDSNGRCWWTVCSTTPQD